MIDTSIIYWINTLDSIRIAAIVIIIVSLFPLGILLLEVSDFWRSAEDVKKYYKWIAMIAIIIILNALIAIFIPSKEASIEMLVAKYATEENIDYVLQQVKDILQEIGG